MSLFQRVNKGISVDRQVDMAAPGALDTDVTLIDLQTGDRFWNNSRDNWILDITNLNDPAAGLQYILTTQRNGKEKKRWYSNKLLTTFNGEVRPGFPIFLGKGTLNLVGQQISGALTLQSYIITLQHDL